MKHFAFTACALILVSCTRAGALPPAEVLKNASEASQTLESASFSIDATIDGEVQELSGALNGEIDITGQMQNAGRQLKFTINADVAMSDDTQTETQFKGSADMVVAGENEAYLRVNSLELTPPNALFPAAVVSQFVNQWWMLPTATGTQLLGADITPDPEFLKMQMNVISVETDRGLTKINGRSAYLYDVTIDEAKMKTYLDDVARRQGKELSQEESMLSTMNAKGTLWIDADTFVIHRIVWDLESKEGKQLAVHIDATISDHNKPMTISLPQGAMPFPTAAGFLPASN